MVGRGAPAGAERAPCLAQAAVQHRRSPVVPLASAPAPPPDETRRARDDVARRESAVLRGVPFRGSAGVRRRDAVGRTNAEAPAERAPSPKAGPGVRGYAPFVVGTDRTAPPDAPTRSDTDQLGHEAAVAFRVPLKSQIRANARQAVGDRDLAPGAIRTTSQSPCSAVGRGRPLVIGPFHALPPDLAARATREVAQCGLPVQRGVPLRDELRPLANPRRLVARWFNETSCDSELPLRGSLSGRWGVTSGTSRV